MSQWGPLAPWGQRAIALLLDYVIVVVVFLVGLILAAIVGAVVRPLGVLIGLVLYLASAAVGFYLFFLNGSVGQTPGKRVIGIKVVSEETGQVIGGGMGIVRGLAHIVDSLACYIGWLFPLWDVKRQTFADKIMKTVVLTGLPKEEIVPAVKAALPIGK